MLRLFIALPVPAPLATAIARIQTAPFAARWQSAAQLHLTLGFVGEVDERAACDLADSLAAITAPPIALALAGANHFARREKVHSLWVGVTDPAPLVELAARIAQAARRAGTPVEARRFLPHVTVARLRVPLAEVAPWIAAHTAFATPTALVSQFHLYESCLGRDGAVYRSLVDYPLR